MNHEKFIYHKTQTIGTVEIMYSWYLIEKKTREGVHFHGTLATKNNPISGLSLFNKFNFMASGIECHRKKPNYEGHTPIKGHCIVTQGECYCDGSSLQASEQLGHINPATDDDSVWSVLHLYFGYWIEEPRVSDTIQL